MRELELYKLLVIPNEKDKDFSYIMEMGWVNSDEFCVWVAFDKLKSFVEELKTIFGAGLFDEGGFTGNIQEDCICFDLCAAVGDLVNISKIFSKEEYKH